MAFKKIPLTIDTMIRNPVPVEGINQEDNVELNIVVTENKTPKDLSSQTIKVYVRRIDGTLVEQTDQITPTNARKGEVTVKLKNSAFNKEGYALFQLDVSDSIGRITSSYATFKIGKGLVSGEAIANTNEIEALKKVEEYIKKANQELETFKQTVTEINENEATRQENEVVRVREEASRNKAEAIRVQQEATRKEKENERVQAETKRIADEEVRRENEVLRGSEELERKQAEELRKEKELLRIADEKNRKVAESKRIEAESVRVEAEKLRVAAETERVEAENLRAIAEEERVVAETKREEGFNKFEGRINANTEELKNARSATTGEKFNSLDERIDCEVDRLNKKIEVSFLQQEDKESHTIDNTVDGMTTDMVVKGRTLQNLWKPISIQWEPTNKWFNALASSINFSITGKVITVKNTTDKTISFQFSKLDNNYDSQVVISSGETKVINVTSLQKFRGVIGLESVGWENTTENKNKLINGLIVCIGEYSYLPDIYFEGIKSFGQEENKISILSTSFNQWNFDDIKTQNEPLKMTIEGNNEKFNIKTSTYADGFYVKINAKANETYVFSGTVKGNKPVNYRIMSPDFKETYAGGNFENIGAFKTQYAPQKDMVIVARIWINTDLAPCECENFYFGLLKGNKQPYKQDKKDILLSQYGFDEGLRGIEYIFDELNSIRNVTIKRIERYTFNGEEKWDYIPAQSQGNTAYFQTNLLDGKVKYPSPRLICNTLKAEVNLWNFDDIEGINVEGNIQGVFCLRIRILKSKLSTTNADGLKAWLKENPTTIYYELAEPVETPLDENIALKTFGEKTYVSFENSLSGTSSFKAPVNAAATISRLNRENRALEEENRSLRQDFESTTLSLTDSDLELVKQNVDIDFRLMEVEFALDIPQSTLSSNINFKNKKGEVKSMARTPYEMLKIVILSGDYDREDYIHKVGKYYERGRMTKEEHDELISLMTADEVIGG